jgi:outer membrane protein
MRRLKILIQGRFFVPAVLVTGAAFLGATCGAAAGDSPKIEVTTSNIKDLVTGNNPRITAATMNATAATTRTGRLGRSFVPSLELRAERENVRRQRGGGADETGSGTGSETAYGAELTVNLFNGGRDRLDEETRKLAATRKEFELRRIAAGEVERARASLLRIIYLQEKIALLKTTIATNAQNLATTQKRIRSGVTTQSDRFDFEMKDVDLRRDLAAVRLELAAERRGIALLTGLEDKVATLSFPEKLSHDHEGEAAPAFGKQDHEFLVKEYELHARELEYAGKRSAREGWPRLDLFAGYTRYSESHEPSTMNRQHPAGTSVGARLSMDLGAGLEGRREAVVLAKEAGAAEVQTALAKREIEAHLETEMAGLSFLHDQVHEAEENIARANKYHELTKNEYARGVKNSPDMLGAADKLYEMRHKRLEIIRDYQMAQAHILSKTGR